MPCRALPPTHLHGRLLLARRQQVQRRQLRLLLLLQLGGVRQGGGTPGRGAYTAVTTDGQLDCI